MGFYRTMYYKIFRVIADAVELLEKGELTAAQNTLSAVVREADEEEMELFRYACLYNRVSAAASRAANDLLKKNKPDGVRKALIDAMQDAEETIMSSDVPI